MPEKHAPRHGDGKRVYAMDYINDKSVYAAVMFARKMIRKGTPAPVAIRRAANYYHVDVRSVAHYVGQVGGTVAGRRRRKREG